MAVRLNDIFAFDGVSFVSSCFFGLRPEERTVWIANTAGGRGVHSDLQVLDLAAAELFLGLVISVAARQPHDTDRLLTALAWFCGSTPEAAPVLPEVEH